MNDKDIVRITKVNNIQIENTHNGLLFPMQNVLEIETRGGDTRVLDLMADRDITEINYFIVHETNKTSRKDLFNEFKDD